MCKTIVIDDNPMEHMIMQKMFDRYQLFSDTAHTLDGAIIIAFLEEYYDEPSVLPDLILLDLNMPYSGWEFLDQLKSLYPALLKQPDVVIVSSSVSEVDQSRAKEYTFVKGYVTKPLQKQTLFELGTRYQESDRLAS